VLLSSKHRRFGDDLKLHADPLTTLNTVTAYGSGFIDINSIRHTGSLLVSPDAEVEPWPVASFDALEAHHFAGVLQRQPEVVLLGTGERQRFPHPRLLRPLAEARIGVEVMTTPAACRTYNILMAEGRRVVAAFLQDTRGEAS
jgi:uncharacterized protein